MEKGIIQNRKWRHRNAEVLNQSISTLRLGLYYLRMEDIGGLGVVAQP